LSDDEHNQLVDTGVPRVEMTDTGLHVPAVADDDDCSLVNFIVFTTVASSPADRPAIRCPRHYYRIEDVNFS